jgi:hypothetical protein
MSGRCKSCDSILSDDDMIKKDSFGDFTELCTYCLVATQRAELELSDGLIDNDFYKTGRRTPHIYED